MTIADALMIAGALALPVSFILWALIEWRGRHVFATRDDLNGVGRRVDQCEAKGERIEAMAESNRERLGLFEAGMKADRRHIDETVAAPIREIRATLVGIAEQVTTIRVEYGSKIGEHDRDLSNLGRGIDELKKRVDRIEDAP